MQAGGLCGGRNGVCEGPICESVTIPSLDCGPEEEEPPEEGCSCCDDHTRRRLLWIGTGCLCCKTKGHATWSVHRSAIGGASVARQRGFRRRLLEATSGSTKVDVSVQTTASKAAQVMSDLSNPAKINTALIAAGLPASEIVQAPKVLNAPPPLSKDWPHHDAQLWKEVKLSNFTWHVCMSAGLCLYLYLSLCLQLRH